MGELEAFYARRRRVTFVICLASALQAILFGSSVLIEGLLTTFDEPPEPGRRTYAFHGLYAKVLGKSEAGAYNPFFYAAAGLSFGNFLLVATMGWLERRAVAAESQLVKSGNLEGAAAASAANAQA